MSDLVSVVISTYNRNELLFGRSLKSVLSQTYKNLDVHVVADGMTGDQRADLEDGMAKLRYFGEHRVRLWDIPRQTYPEDQGQKWCVLGLNARNHGLDQAVGDWIAPLDDDDEWTTDHVEVLLHAAKSSGVQFAYGVSLYHWPDGHFQTAGSWPPGYGAFCDGAQLYRNGLGYRYDPGCIERGLPEDGDLWNRMRDGGVTFTFLQQIVHHYHVNPR